MKKAKRKQKSGRPRSVDSHRAVIETVKRMLSEGEIQGISFNKISEASGVGKPTILKWWTNKGDLILEALLELAKERTKARPLATSKADYLNQYLRETFLVISDPALSSALRMLCVEAQLNQEFKISFWKQFLLHRRQDFATSFDLPKNSASTEASLDVVFGTFWYRILLTPDPPGPKYLKEVEVIFRRLVNL